MNVWGSLAEARARVALARHAELSHGAFRAARPVAITLGTTALLLVALIHPAAREVTRVYWNDALIVLGGFLAVSAGAAASHAYAGYSSPGYRFLSWMETAWSALGSLYLVYYSGSAISFFWVFFLGVVGQSGSFGANIRSKLVLLIGGPVALAGAFTYFRHDPASALLTLAMAGVSLSTFYTTFNSTVRLAEAIGAREDLEGRHRELLVLRERERIARDLHDGLGAELTSLLYRVQTLRLGERSALPVELDSVADRLRESVGELRDVVWVLRHDHQRVADIVAWLRTRCADLCGVGIAHTLEVQGDENLMLPGELRMHLTRIVLEAVRNAVRHGQPRKLSVSIGVSGQLKVQVQDDGCGLGPEVLARNTGGLANLRTRSAAVSGSLDVSSTPAGTVVRFVCPLPASAEPLPPC